MKINTKKYPRLICIVGLDGAGKSTVSKEFVKNAKEKGINYRYSWVNNQPIFMYILRFFWRLRLKIKKVNNYNDYKEEKKSLSQHSLINIFYEIVHRIDYVIWVWLKVKFPLLRGKRIVVDRYYFDVAINYTLIDDYNEEKLMRKISEYMRWMPKPDLTFYLKVSEEVAFSRKDDIPAMNYLYERKKIYEKLADKFNMIEINGEDRIDNIVEEIYSYLEKK